MPSPSKPVTIGARVEVRGVVQGVGFRPFVHRLATELELAGSVRNDGTAVLIEIEGPLGTLDEFARRLEIEAPPLATIEHLSRRRAPAEGWSGFTIARSTQSESGAAQVAADIATCTACLRELFDPTDRRFGHPFITCTDCGPRFTIIRALPYDRASTTMAEFAMCESCRSEFEDPDSRRHHAQPIACHDCGPTLSLTTAGRPLSGTDALRGAVATLRAGGTVAVKGLGGFHLCCAASDDAAVGRLRARKHRPDKPLAVMVGTVAAARALADLDEVEVELLAGPERPIVLVRRRAGPGLSDLVAPDNPLIGIMLPSTPLHHLLAADHGGPLVMTSGNVAGEPLVYRDDDCGRLLPMVDAVLSHDRAIVAPCDDSVVRVVAGAAIPLRRARGFAPMSLPMPGARRQVLAVGADLKNTFCIVGKQRAWVSQHLGDMADLETLRSFEEQVTAFCSFYGVDPEVVVADAHPAYRSSRWARAHHADRLHLVQHHHAHVAAVMAEHDLDPHEPVIGVAFDGTGFGADQTSWGGEILVADVTTAHRWAHLVPVPLPGGDATVRSPATTALAHLHASGIGWAAALAPVRHLDPRALANLDRQLTSGFGCVPSSSMGRLFDTIASLLDLRHEVTFEAQAAIDLEIAAQRATTPRRYALVASDGQIDTRPFLRAIVADVIAGHPTPDIARGFHDAVVGVICQVTHDIRASGGPATVVLAGGVFQNAVLMSTGVERLRSDGFEVRTHRLVPPNDGGLSLGQAYIAAHRADPMSEV